MCKLSHICSILISGAHSRTPSAERICIIIIFRLGRSCAFVGRSRSGSYALIGLKRRAIIVLPGDSIGLFVVCLRHSRLIERNRSSSSSTGLESYLPIICRYNCYIIADNVVYIHIEVAGVVIEVILLIRYQIEFPWCIKHIKAVRNDTFSVRSYLTPIVVCLIELVTIN